MITGVVGYAGLGCCAVGFLFSLLALALPYWETLDSNGIKGNIGLWRYCLEIGSAETCGDPLDLDLTFLSENNKDALRGTRAMVLLAFFCIIGAIVSVVLLLFVMKEQKILGFIGGGAALVGGFFLMVSMAVYSDNLANDDFDYSAGFVFAILGWLVDWVAGALLIFEAIQGNGEVGSS